MRFRTVAVIILALAVAPLCLSGCSDSEEGQVKENLPPRVWLSSAPPEGSTDKYTIHMFWGGWDPDGEIAYYEYAITDNGDGPFIPEDTVGTDKWSKVVSNDSLFTFTADILSDSNTTDVVSEFVRSHTFFIRAVDRQGLSSVEPAYRSFTARTLSPEVRIQVPRRTGLNPALVPPISTFRWVAQDYISDLLSIQEPEFVQWALVNADEGYDKTIDWMRTSPDADSLWGPWVNYKAPEDSGKFWTTQPVDLGQYIFVIRAMDEAGAITPVLDEAFNVRRLRVSRRSSGPIMTVTNPFLGTVTTSVCNSPLVILDIPSGVPLEFCWRASADTYGGLVSGYRYGWDIADLDDPDQWEVDFTPFTTDRPCAPTRTFFFGTHTFTVEVVDNSGFCSRLEIKVNVVQFTMSRNLILFDDFEFDKDSNGLESGARMPSDPFHDAFWEDMLSNVAGWDPVSDVVEVTTGSVLPLTKVADYKTIVWSVYSDKGQLQQLPLLYAFVQHREKNPPPGAGGTGKQQPNLLALFMSAGGHLFLNGLQPVSNVRNRGLAPDVRYPLILEYELENEQGEDEPDIDNPIGDLSFGYRDLCVDVLDYCILEPRTRREDAYCEVVDERTLEGNVIRDDTMREAIPLDPNFPRLELRAEAASPGRAYDENVRGLDSEIYNPQYFMDMCDSWVETRDCFEPIYGLSCLDTLELTYGQPVAFWTSAFADRLAEVPGAVAAPSVVYGFPPVFFDPEQVKPGIEYILFDKWELPRTTR